tara:strand:- start:1457 stop:1666 length:210 start_codon:yes stop_codon:yes gene_type:complete
MKNEKIIHISLTRNEWEVLDRFTKTVGLAPTTYSRSLVKQNIPIMRKKLIELDQEMKAREEDKVPGLNI